MSDHNQHSYCSQLWNPYLIKDTVILEKIQRQAIKFILSDYVSDYKTRLLKLDLLPLMYILDFYDILFFIKALKQPSDHYNIHHHVSFSTNNTRSASTNKLNPILILIVTSYSTLTDYLEYGTNYHLLT